MTTDPTPRCPYPHHLDQRKTNFDTERAPGIEQQNDIWYLRSYHAVRQVLKDAERVRQGVSTDNPLVKWVRPSVFFLDGAPHREQRSAIARFFTPTTVQQSHDHFITALTDQIIHDFTSSGHADLSDLSMRLAVDVAARVVGLTNSRRSGMAGRIDRLLSQSDDGLLDATTKEKPSWSRRTADLVGAMGRTLAFYLTDVQPAIRARRKVPQEDVISHLLSKGYNNLDILVECLTYATAGMVTTREFIGVAAWYLLEHEDLRREYLAADRAARHRILHEILRLEPVASTLMRRAEQALELEHGGVTHHVPAGAQMVLDIRTANADPAAVGEDALEVCPHRALPSGVQAQAMSFGDGPHRCPGAFLAIHESDVFLQRLLSLPVRMAGAPQVAFNLQLMSYEIRDFQLTLGQNSAS